MEQKLKELRERLENAFHDRLVSVVLYGSAAVGDHHARFSDLNVLCVLRQVTPRELGEAEPIFRWWRELKNPSPLLMSEEEVHNSADSFPIEFRDIMERRKVLHGPDVFADVKVDRTFYRAQVEHELRAKLFRLRQQAAGVLSDRRALLKLCLDSVSTFCVLARHLLLASGVEAKAHKHDVVRQIADQLKIDMKPFETLLELREEKRVPEEVDPQSLFERYLDSIRRLVEHVDKLNP